MHLPPSHVAAGPATPTPSSTSYNGLFWLLKDKGGYTEGWSSLIGIVTAIVGNVLISFALNIQRYAHIRLNREWQEKERQRKKRNASSTSLAKLGGTNGKKGSRPNHSPQQSGDLNGHVRYTDSAGREASESDPLISQPHTRPSLESHESTDSGLGEEAYKQQSYLRSPYWWIGIILMTIGETGNFLAYGFAPASIVSPLGVVALISNCIIAPFMLKEPFRKRDALGVVIAVGGAVTVVLSASDSNPKLGPHEIWDLIRRWEFETYLGITIAVIAVLMVCSNRFGEKHILIDVGLVGLFGGFTALSTKGVSSLLSYTLWRAITFPVFYLLVAILVGTAIMQIKYINRALQRFDATQVIPVQFVLFTLSVIAGSAILYRDFERTSSEDAQKFVGGCALTFFGVWLITSGRPPRRDEDDSDREPEPEDAISLVSERYRDSVDGMSEGPRSSSPPIEIHTRYRDSPASRPYTPSAKHTPETPTPNPLLNRRGSEDVIASLIGNPWAQGTDPPHSAPVFSRHTSTPVLPSEAAPPPITSASDPSLALPPIPHTPTRGKSHDERPSTPTAQSQLRRLRTGDRISYASIQGPLLASPLSTALSMMVQDRKRGGSIRHKDADGSARRRESVLGIGASEIDGGPVGEPLDRRRTVDSGERERDREDAGMEEGSRPRNGRGRSLSGTLGELWRGVRGRGSREEIRGEEDGDGER